MGMRALAKQGAKPCPPDIPSDLLKANCVPPGFMVPKGWDIVCSYYQNVDNPDWIPYSVEMTEPNTAKDTKTEGRYGSEAFKLTMMQNGRPISPWHDLPLMSSTSDNLYNMVNEIPMYSTAKMEMNKVESGNPIMQDLKDNKPRFYTYGTPFFNYGFFPQTWEDPDFHGGDNDPIDVIEVGETPLSMGSIVSVRVLGALKLIDEGETDHKIIVLRSDDPHFNQVHNMADLEKVKPGVKDRLVDWLLNYKTTDGKPQNQLSSMEPTTSEEAVSIINDVNKFYLDLIKPGSTKNTYGFYLPSGVVSPSSSSSSSFSSMFSSSSAGSSSSSNSGSTSSTSSDKKSKINDAYGVRPV